MHMNAFLLALTFTIAVALDYLWERFENRLDNEKKAHRMKTIAVICLLVFAWIQAGLQFKRDRESDKDMNYLKAQLAAANISLTNSTETVKGMATGGDSYPEIRFSAPHNNESNTLTINVKSNGDYPLRNLGVRIQNETQKIIMGDKDGLSSNLPSGKVVFDRQLGDQPIGAIGDLCNIKFDPAVTNWYRFDFHAMNGFSWELIKFYQVSETNGWNGWIGQLHYRFRKFGGPTVIEPTNWGNALMVY